MERNKRQKFLPLVLSIALIASVSFNVIQCLNAFHVSNTSNDTAEIFKEFMFYVPEEF